MSISQTNMIAKIAAVVAGLGLVAMSFASFAVPAKAATSDVSAQIAALQAQLAALMASQGSTGACTSFMANLTVGSTGADVSALQNWLIGKGFSIPAGATGYFGGQTKAALASYQASAGIAPAVGFFGPLTRGHINALGCATGNTGGSTVGGLSGGAGKLKNIDSLGDTESDLKEGDSATKVLGFSADAQDSDVAVQRVDVTITLGGSGSSAASKYFDTVALYQDGKKLGSMSASSGDKDGRVWTYRFSDVNGVIREGNTGNFYVEVTPVSSISSPEGGASLTVAIPTDGIRAVDAEGVSETYSISSGSSDTFSVSTATTGTLTINEASDNPKSTSVKADINDTTTGVTLLSFNLKAKNQDVTVHDLPVNLVANGISVSDYVQTVKLMKGSTVLKSKSVTSATSTQTVVFDGIDQTISQDSSVNYSVVVDVRKIDAGGSNTFGSGDSLTASVPSNGPWDTEDANGDSVVNPTTFTGNAITFQATGITVTKVDASYNKSVGTTVGSGDSTQFSVSFKVTAGDDDLYIARTLTRTLTPSTTSTTWATTTGSTASSSGSTSASLGAGDTNSSDTSTYYKVPSGTNRTFTLNVTMVANQTGFLGVGLTGIAYGTTTAFGTAYTSGLDTFKTGEVSMTTH